jgi:hypothetical protein
MKPVFFTVTGDFRAVLEDSVNDTDHNPDLPPISAKVTFTPILAAGDVILATSADPRPTGYVPVPIVGIIDSADGRVKMRPFSDDGVAEFAPVRLLADGPFLELKDPLFYRVTFSEVRLGNKPGAITAFSFQAPTRDTEINLISVMRQPGQPPSGVIKVAPGSVRIDGAGRVVFSYGGVDIPSPLDKSGLKGDPGPSSWDAIPDRPENVPGGFPVLDAKSRVPDEHLPERLTFNVRDFGALGDGAANDLAAVHAARDAAGVGGTVYFPPGTYSVSQMVADVEGQKWLLSDKAILKLSASADLLRIVADNVTVDGGVFDASASTGSADHAITVSYADGVTVRNITAKNGSGFAIQGEGCNRLTVTNNKLIDFGGASICIYDSGEFIKDIVVSDNFIDAENGGLYHVGIVIRGEGGEIGRRTWTPSNIIVSRNVIRLPIGGALGPNAGGEGSQTIDNVSVGISVMYGESWIIDSNVITGGLFGITCGSPRRAVISNNSIRRFSTYGIEIPSAGINLDYCTVTGNVIDQGGIEPPEPYGCGISCTAGPSVTQVNHLTISNNTIGGFTAGADTWGIIVGGRGATVTNSTVSGNTVVADRPLFFAGATNSVAVSGNILDGGSKANSVGLQMENSANGVAITGNQFSNLGNSAVALTANGAGKTVDNLSMTGNTVRNCPAEFRNSLSGGATLGSNVFVDERDLLNGMRLATIYDNNGKTAVEFPNGPGDPVNHVRIRNSAGSPRIDAAGPAADIGLSVESKGTSTIFVSPGATNCAQFSAVTSAVNFLRFSGAVAGGAPTILATGSDADVPLELSARGAGVVRADGVQVEVKGHTHTVAQVIGARSWASVPVNANAPGTAGQEAYDSNFHYVCVATNVWKRAPLTTW